MLPGPAHFLMRVSALPMASSGVGQERARVPRLRDVQSISYKISFLAQERRSKRRFRTCALQPTSQSHSPTRRDYSAVGLAGLKTVKVASRPNREGDGLPSPIEGLGSGLWSSMVDTGRDRAWLVSTRGQAMLARPAEPRTSYTRSCPSITIWDCNPEPGLVE